MSLRAVPSIEVFQDPEDLEESFGVTFRRAYPRLVRFLTRRTGDVDLAEDLAQEAFARALRGSDRWDWDRSIWPLLKTIATNLLIDHVRRSARETMTSEPVEEMATERPEGTNLDPLVLEALAQLPVRHRVALALRYLEDWRAVDAAAYIGVSVPAFEQLMFRARRRLRTEYERLNLAARVLIILPLRRLRGSRSIPESRASDLLFGATQLGAHAVANVMCVLFTAVAAAGPGLAPAARPAPRPNLGPAEVATRARMPRPQQKAPAPQNTSAVAPTSEDKEPASPARVAEDLTRPNKDVRQPEDATITSFAFSPNFEHDRTMFASGTAHCRLRGACPQVLFLSRDRGSSWTKLSAEGFMGAQLLLPPAYGATDERIFAMGYGGLQVSADGGKSFATAALGGAPYAMGSAAISPAFNSGDPTIAIGSTSMMRYDDVRAVVEPAPYTAIPGPLEPTYAVGPNGAVLIAGGLRVDPATGAKAIVFTCSTAVCSEATLQTRIQDVPRVRASSTFEKDGTIYAFTEGSLSRSTNGGTSFETLMTPWRSGILRDIAASSKTVYAAVVALRRDGLAGLFVSHDGGQSWNFLRDRLLRNGVAQVAVQGDRLVVALEGSGVACSTDDGRSWQKRCAAKT